MLVGLFLILLLITALYDFGHIGKHNLIILKYNKDESNFFERNKDRLVIAFFSAIITAVITYVLTLLFT